MTIKEAVQKSGTPVALSGASISAAESLIHPGEQVLYAVVTTCGVDSDTKFGGILVVTSHRILYTRIPGTTFSFYLCLKDCVGVGDITEIPCTGYPLQHLKGCASTSTDKSVGSMPISSKGHTITVQMDRDHLLSLQTAILDAVAGYPNQRPIVFPRV